MEVYTSELMHGVSTGMGGGGVPLTRSNNLQAFRNTVMGENFKLQLFIVIVNTGCNQTESYNYSISLFFYWPMNS